ncbi:hypothetical protein GZL_00931 [Streptomyces sp. 769]|nr:hypothetical protein GZL_00931 [Streptomyces sp. 769]
MTVPLLDDDVRAQLDAATAVRPRDVWWAPGARRK